MSHSTSTANCEKKLRRKPQLAISVAQTHRISFRRGGQKNLLSLRRSTSKMFEHPKKALGGLAKKCPTRLALRTAKKCALQTPARNSWLDQLLARSPEAGAHRHKKRCWPWIHNPPTGKHIKMSSFCGPDAHDPQGRSSQFKYYPHLLALSNPKKIAGAGGADPPCAPPRRRCAAPGLGCAQPKAPESCLVASPHMEGGPMAIAPDIRITSFVFPASWVPCSSCSSGRRSMLGSS